MAEASSARSACGIRIASSASASLRDAIAELRLGLGDGEFQHVLAFFSAAHEPESLFSALATAFPDIPVTGCSTAGEITPAGMIENGVLLIAFPKEGFRIHTALIEGIGEFAVERASETVRRLKSQLRGDGDRKRADRAFALMLVDGLSNAEETLVAAVHWAIDDVHLVGGSAGDGLAFRRTFLLHEGNIVSNAAVLIMVETDFPFCVFKSQNFEPTAIKLVVTAADTRNRIVYELNAEPAALEYASAIGLMPADLGPFSFAAYPLVVKVGGDYYCRSIRNMNPDGSLSFFCAIDEGLVFTVARPQDMVASTTQALQEVDKSLGGVDFVLGFDCVLRRLDAENRQIRHHMEDIYRKFGVVGFQTYGEQFNAMHLNQTLTGIGFGRRPG